MNDANRSYRISPIQRRTLWMNLHGGETENGKAKELQNVSDEERSEE